MSSFIFVMQSEDVVRREICSRRGSDCFAAIQTLFAANCGFDINDAGEYIAMHYGCCV